MHRQRGSIYPYLAAVAVNGWVRMVDEQATLSQALERYQENSDDNQAEAQLAIALTRVIEKQVRPSLEKKLRPQDVDDVCSEVVLGFWKFRLSVRPDETAKLVNTLVQRRLSDQLRGYYKETEHVVSERAEDERALLELLPAKADAPGAGADQDVWELLYGLELSAQDHIVAYLVHQGIEKQVIADVLSLSTATVSHSLKRCREALAARVKRETGDSADA